MSRKLAPRGIPVNAVELLNKRGVHVKHFQVPGEDNIFAFCTRRAQNYFDGSQWQEIDPTWRKQGNNWVIDNAPYDVTVPNRTIGFDYQSKNSFETVSRRLVAINDVPVNPNQLSFNAQTNAEQDLLIFPDIVPGLDIYIEALSGGVEMFKRVKDPSAPTKLTWSIEEPDFPVNIINKLEAFARDNENELPRPGERYVRREAVVNTLIVSDSIVNNRRVVEFSQELTGETIFKPRRDAEVRLGELIYPVVIDDQTIETLVADADDGWWFSFSSGTWYTNAIYMESNYGGNPNKDGFPGWRFQSVGVPAGSTINSGCVLTVQCLTAKSGSSGTLKGNDTDSAPAWGADPNNPETMTGTTATATLDSGTTGQKTPDVTTIIAEIIARTGWASGNHLAIGVQTPAGFTTSADASFQDYPHANEGTLTINYTPPAGGGATNFRTLSLMGVGR